MGGSSRMAGTMDKARRIWITCLIDLRRGLMPSAAADEFRLLEKYFPVESERDSVFELFYMYHTWPYGRGAHFGPFARILSQLRRPAKRKWNFELA